MPRYRVAVMETERRIVVHEIEANDEKSAKHMVLCGPANTRGDIVLDMGTKREEIPPLPGIDYMNNVVEVK